MPLFMIERQFADELDVTPDIATAVNEINADEGVRWLYSFLSADKRKTFCIYEAPDPQALLAAAARGASLQMPSSRSHRKSCQAASSSRSPTPAS